MHGLTELTRRDPWSNGDIGHGFESWNQPN